MSTQNTHAGAVLAMLEARHHKDVFVSECKDGPTWGGGAMRLDAWAMKRSWAHPCTTGYEIKVSRSDWLNDKKWPAYTDLVHEFYLVAPDGVIDVAEVPAGIGLMRVPKTGDRLMVKRKAAHKEPAPEAQNLLLTYVLMSRATIDAPLRHRTTIEDWKAWLKSKRDMVVVGHKVSKALREAYERDVRDVQVRLASVQNEAECAREVREACAALGINLDLGRWVYAAREAQRIARALGSPALTDDEIKQLHLLINRVAPLQ